MPNEIIQAETTDLEISDFLSAVSDDEQYEDLSASPWTDYGIMKMNRGDTGFSLEFGGQKVRPNEILITLLGRNNYYARRAMFPPEGENTGDGKPMCGTPLVDPGRTAKQNWIGKFSDGSILKCVDCPRSEFGGDCRETRLVWFVAWQEIGGVLTPIADVPFRFSVPLTSIAAMDALIKRAKLLTITRGETKVPVPLIATVWLMRSEVIRKGGFTFSKLLPPELSRRMPSKAQFAWLQELSNSLWTDLDKDRREHTLPEGTDGRRDPMDVLSNNPSDPVPF